MSARRLRAAEHAVASLRHAQARADRRRWWARSLTPRRHHPHPGCPVRTHRRGGPVPPLARRPREPVPGVLVFTGAPATWHQRLAIACAVANHAGVVSFRSAGRLQVVDGLDHYGGLDVTVVRGTQIRLSGVVRHQVLRALPPNDITMIDGLRCTSLARTLVDLAAALEPNELERALDDFERRGFSLNWLEQTATRSPSAGPARHEADPGRGRGPSRARSGTRVVVREAGRAVPRLSAGPTLRAPVRAP